MQELEPPRAPFRSAIVCDVQHKTGPVSNKPSDYCVWANDTAKVALGALVRKPNLGVAATVGHSSPPLDSPNVQLESAIKTRAPKPSKRTHDDNWP